MFAIVAIALLASCAVAQTVNIAGLPLTLKAQWCNAQQTACPQLCVNTANNTCDSTTLDFNCTCSNGSAPGLLFYENTVPTFLCVEQHKECIAGNATSSQAQTQCNETEEATCGLMLNPASVVQSSSTSSQAASATGGSATTTGGAPATAASSSKAAAAPTMAPAREIGTGIFAVGAAAAFNLLV